MTTTSRSFFVLHCQRMALAVASMQLVAPRLFFFFLGDALPLSQNLLLGLITGLCVYFISLLARPIAKSIQ